MNNQLSTAKTVLSYETCDNGKRSLSFEIQGEPASKANSRRLVMFGDRPASIKSAKACRYTDLFREQCPQLQELMTGALAVTVTIYYASRRPDLDESVILDCMQGYVYENDRQVKERHVYWGLDEARPRACINVTQIDPPKGYAKINTAKKRVSAGNQRLLGKRKGTRRSHSVVGI